MMCQWKFMDFNKRTTLAWNIDVEWGYMYVGMGVYGSSVLSALFYCDPKTTLKYKTIEKKKKTAIFNSLNHILSKICLIHTFSMYPNSKIWTSGLT